MQIDDELSLISTNPVQNKVVTAAMNGKQDISNLVTSVSSSSTDTQYISAKYIQDMLVAKLSMTIDDIISQRGTYYYAWEVTESSMSAAVGIMIYLLNLSPDLADSGYLYNGSEMTEIKEPESFSTFHIDSISGTTMLAHLSVNGSTAATLTLERTPSADIIIKPS